MNLIQLTIYLNPVRRACTPKSNILMNILAYKRAKQWTSVSCSVFCFFIFLFDNRSFMYRQDCFWFVCVFIFLSNQHELIKTGGQNNK